MELEEMGIGDTILRSLGYLHYHSAIPIPEQIATLVPTADLNKRFPRFLYIQLARTNVQGTRRMLRHAGESQQKGFFLELKHMQTKVNYGRLRNCFSFWSSEEKVTLIFLRSWP